MKYINLKKLLTTLLLALVIGSFTGLATTFFLHSVSWATQVRKDNSWIILFLPLIGFFVALFYKHFGSDYEEGSKVIVTEIHSPQKILSFRIVPMIFISTIFSHMFGASVGREGVAVQIGAGIGDQFSKISEKFYIERKIILLMGMSAGFSAVFGTPIAGTIFAMEVLIVRMISFEVFFPCLFSALIGFYTTYLLGVVHPKYFYLESSKLSLNGLLSCVLAGLFFGNAAKIYIWSLRKIKDLLRKNLTNKLHHPILGGIILVLIFYFVGTDRYNGLGEDIILSSFTQHIYPWDFLGKMFTTIVSIASGFKGGEVMSLFYIGSTLGNALSYILPLDFPILAALGFVSVFSGAFNTPITAFILALELFGTGISTYAALAIVISYIFSGKSSIFYSQIGHIEKKI